MTLLVVSPFTANADEKSIAETGATSGTTGDCTWEFNNGVLTISGNGDMANYINWEYSLEARPWHNYDITKVIIKSGVTYVGDFAFYNFNKLTSVTIPDSVKNIGKNAFHNTPWLNDLLENQPKGLVYVGKVAYIMNGSCPADVVLKDDTSGIAGGAFYNCKSLTNITIPNSVTNIGSCAFYNSGLTNITIPDSVTSIGISAFADCAGLTSVKISQYALNHIHNIFYDEEGGHYNTPLKNVILSDNVTKIGSDAFRDCSLTSVTIPDSVTSIGSFAFRYSRLTSIDIPDSVTSIGGFAFYGCTGLTSVTIGNSVSSIGSSTFESCNNLTSVTIGNSVTSIGSSAFYNCTSLTNVTIPDSVTSIGSSAFKGCTSLTSVTIPDSVEAIASNAFYGCSSLTSVTIPASVTDIYDKAFGYYNKTGFGESKVKDFTIYGYKGSEAERYANDNNFKFTALDDEPSDPTKTTDREIFGDIDGDGIITVVDSTFLQRYAIQAETPYPIGEKMK